MLLNQTPMLKKTFAIKTLVKIKTHTNNYKIQKNNVSFHTCKS